MLDVILGVFLGLLAQSPAAPVSAVHLSAPHEAGAINTGKLKGEPTRLAWSTDGTQLYLETSERDAVQMLKNPRFFVFPLADVNPKAVESTPAWATQYWGWKSGQAAPGRDTFAIDAKTSARKVGTESPMGGSQARPGDVSGGGTQVQDVTTRTEQNQSAKVITLTAAGETVGEFLNGPLLPGYTFGWSPASLGLIAFGDAQGKLAVMDAAGKKVVVPGTRNVVLPAWSPDGTQIAYLEKESKNKYDLCIVTVTK